ncbi:uncharacterized protein PV06_03462 [Exophiala oligosperma]|uniref:Zn(2)-C6 fungal-type domain-containing protein n=1 Tax=Exophiala oligosperma TaxID=215243 RepID=A0A0D2AZ07_9EURO|nr:uncharacterized protein PV06_03462 [Exophiala oligosperma]KIW45041.1 hypothetical protein PV06_03462 [Exophiala oligosperma]
MARSINGRDQSGDDPASSFAGPANSQFDASSFNFPIDTQLAAMNPNYGMSTYPRDLDDPTASLAHSGAAQLNSLATPSNGADASMAPPQTPNQASFMSTRKSVDGLSDAMQIPLTGDKRKRSKTSRACDECRRKKVRCDAPTEADGTPKTCTNCQKTGVTCEFERKPMKRGPSKGYIKELAERVQQVEHVQKQALRQSVDGTSNFAGYAEAFSPDEATTRRNFSFPDPRSPFAPADFQRDRIPSTGAWGNVAPSLRSRDTGSLAIAPDQPLPESVSSQEAVKMVAESVKPFWSEIDSPPPPKRARLDDTYAKLEKFDISEKHLNNYYTHVHPHFALLPQANSVIELVSNSVPAMQHAFALSIELLDSSHNESAVNGNQRDQPSAPSHRRDLPTTAFDTFHDLTIFVVSVAQDAASNTLPDNLTSLWTLLLLAAACDSDVNQITGPKATKNDLLASSLRVIHHLKPRVTHIVTDEMDADQIDEIVKQAFSCQCLMSKLHDLSSGSYARPLTPLELQDKEAMVGPADTAKMPAEAGFLAQSSNIITMVTCLLHLDSYSFSGSQAKRILTFGLFENTLKSSPTLSLDSPFVRQVKLLLELLTARYPDTEFSPMIVLLKATQLADFLTTEAATYPHFSPFDMHCWSLATITFCELAMHAKSDVYTKPALENMLRLKSALQQKSEFFHKQYGYAFFWSPEKSVADEYRMSHWADCLVNMIDDVTARSSTLGEGANDDTLVLPNFSLLLMQGWFRALYHYRWKD